MQRQTVQRKAILDTIHELGHSTIDTIAEKVQEEHPNISLATIYRNLDVLEQDGLIRKIPTKYKVSFYEDASLPEHDHFICESCLKIKDVNIEDSRVHETMKDGDLYLSEIREYYGLCSECLSKAHKKEE